ncbi:AAA family ATPase [Nocardioides KLBMP 9356]|uniref:AAA family ATPase n=1 Tax=Nocardioides potassii TaxID=2911371 RepID=A0ABS9HB87_9ACTN|nr:AAA family ATPase [Nocardioides potassii]MCF6378416.1 AAA family ATPase [Nocardioides potassii]
MLAPVPAPADRAGLVGRDGESRLLRDLLDRARAGAAVSGLLVGEAGIGKSALLRSLMAEGRERGFVVGVASSSEDNDAPPLWPWARLVAQLTDATGGARPDVPDLVARLARGGATSLEAAFEVREGLAQLVLSLARNREVLLVLHWADVPTLRTITHLIARASEQSAEQLDRPVRLVVVASRRPMADPPPALRELEGMVARTSGLQLRVDGLEPDDAAELVGLVAGTEVRGLAPAWLFRTGGNPFFLLELARLAATDPDWHGEVPPSVQQVVGHRLADVPEESRDLLVLAAALGESFSPLVLAAVAERPPTHVQDLLEPAADVGLVREVGDGAVRFEHALTRDAVLAGQTPTQLSRVHARIAHALEAMPPGTRVRGKHAFELARHWLAAGPVHAPSAWRAATAAAEEAAALSAHRESADLLQSAVESHALDPFGTRREHLDLLVALADAGAAAARMPVVLSASKEAVALARVDGDAKDVARIAEALTRYSLWTPTEWGVVDVDLVDDLRWALRSADPGDHGTRARLMLALAAQLYYDDSATAEAVALVDEGVAMVRRVGDDDLGCWAARAAHLALWRPRHFERMEELARTELDAALATSNDGSRCFALTTLAALAMIRGDRSQHDDLMAQAFSLARRRRLPFALIGLCFVELGFAAARRRDEEADALEDELLATARSTTIAAQSFLSVGVAFARGFADDAVLAAHADTWLAIARSDAGRLQTAAITGAALARLGRLDDLADLAPSIPPPPDDWGALGAAAHHAEVAAALGDAAMASRVVDLLREHRAGIALAGIAVAAGPVASFLALAEHALGDDRAAARAADEAVAVAQAWGYVAHVDWVERQRQRYGF